MPAAEASRQELAEETLGLFRRVMGRTISRFEGGGPPKELPFLQHFALHYAMRDHGATQRDLAHLLGVTPGHVTGLVDRLERSGLVARVRDAADRRLIHVTATHRAHQMHRRAHAEMLRFATPIFDGWSEDEIRQLHDLLLRLVSEGGPANDAPLSGTAPTGTSARAGRASARRRAAAA